ncbi:MAG TPA: hypothetical protein VIF57_29975 [Polyangia bacterium]
MASVAMSAATVLGGARLAAAQTEPMEPIAPALTWHAPAGCPSEGRVMAEVGQNLAGSGALVGSFAAVVGVRRPTGGRWQASLLFQARGARAERRFEAESCEAIASAAALVIALWAEGGADAPSDLAPPGAPRAGATAPAPFVPAPTDVPRSPTVIARAAPARPAPAVEPARPRFVLMMNWLLDRNTMPTAPALGIEVAGGRIWSGARWRARALGGVRYFPSQRTPYRYGDPQGDLQLVDVTSSGCLTFAGDRFELGPCAGAALSVMHGSGAGFEDATQTWLSLQGGAVISWRVYPSVALIARGEVVVPTTRRAFESPWEGGLYELYKVPAVAGRGAVGIEMRFQ